MSSEIEKNGKITVYFNGKKVLEFLFSKHKQRDTYIQLYKNSEPGTQDECREAIATGEWGVIGEVIFSKFCNELKKLITGKVIV